ncbi:hypothetical protein V0288_24135 [Pannus brasiliensis CCIBt3594]|uniref:Uncharacterized protein n=1 Tax=Pannus brasiliensis CCIBt3594 TaxID=1427578 RepID=A0AAW9R0W2_9CHRO
MKNCPVVRESGAGSQESGAGSQESGIRIKNILPKRVRKPPIDVVKCHFLRFL